MPQISGASLFRGTLFQGVTSFYKENHFRINTILGDSTILAVTLILGFLDGKAIPWGDTNFGDNTLYHSLGNTFD